MEAPFYTSKAKEGVDSSSSAADDNEEQVLFPVMVFSHGLHAHRTVYSGVCCELSSHGYVVAAVEHKDKSACLTFDRVPGRGVAEGDYDKYINQWIPALVRPTDIFPFRNEQVKSLYTQHAFAVYDKFTIIEICL